MSRHVAINSDHRHKNRFLIEASCAPSTLSKYKRGVQLFLDWCQLHSINARTYIQLDDALTDYFHELYEQGDGSGKGLAAQTFYGIIKFIPRSVNRLSTAHASLQGWLKLRPSQSYPPLTWDLTVLVAVQLTRMGHLRAGIATLLAFDCFLRVGELVKLHRGDVADSGDMRLGSEYHGVALRLRHTKTGPNQWVEVESKEVKQLLRIVMESVPSDDSFLFPYSAGQYRNLFKQACAELGLSSSYVPHSLRHGGATQWHLRGKPLEDILMRGRWASTKSARRYVQAGRAMLLATSVPPTLVPLGHTLACNIYLALVLSLSLPQVH